MFISDLPGELIARILSYIDKVNFYESMRVCKAWHRLGAPRYYSNTILHKKHVDFLERLYSIKHLDDTRIGEFIETLTIRPSKCTPKHQTLTRDQFQRLMKLLPRLQTLRFDPDGDMKLISKYLIYFNMDVQHFPFSVTQVAMDDVDSVAAKTKQARSLRRLHYMANRILHEQITAFSLHDLDIRMLRGEVSRLLTRLAKFQRLTHFSLHVKSAHHWYYAESDLHASSVLRVCPRLVSLNFETSIGWTDPFTLNDPIYTHLTHLTLVIPSMDKHNVHFLLHHTPNLQHLDLHSYYKTSITELFTSLDTATRRQFITFLRQLTYLSLRGSSFSNVQDTALFWSIVHDLYKDTMVCNVRILIRSAMQYNEEISFDNKGVFSVYCEWICHDDLEPEWSRHLEFMQQCAAVTVAFEDYVHRQVPLSELLVPALLRHGTYVKVSSKDQRIVLGSKLENGYGWDFSGKYKQRPHEPCGFFFNVKDLNDTVRLVGTHYSHIDEVSVRYCDVPQESDNRYVLDLLAFSDLQKLTFDLDLMIQEGDPLDAIHVQLNRGDQIYHYVSFVREETYRKVLDFGSSEKSWDGEMISKDCPLLKILTTGNLECVELQSEDCTSMSLHF